MTTCSNSPENVLKRQKAFRKLSKDRKRVAIAKDVIAQLKSNKYQASPGDWCFISNVSSDKFDTQSEVRDVINDNDTTCEVCATGGIFASCVRLNDQFKITNNRKPIDNVDNTLGILPQSVLNHTGKFFSKSQIRLIENAFECGNGYFAQYGFNSKDLRAIAFGEKFNTSEACMIAIMENIIENKGEFKP